MAPTATTSSPRDHAADDNLDLARKRQRLSEDSGASPGGSVIIEEVGDPEDVGSNMDNAIQIEDDPGFTTISYLDAFATFNHLSPQQQLEEITQRVTQNHYLETSPVLWLSTSLTNHIDQTANDADSWSQHYIEDDAVFFDALVVAAFHLLQAGELFEPSVDLSRHVKTFGNILIGLQTLCQRIIPLLPGAVKATLSRRDSAQVSTRPQPVMSLKFIWLLEKVLDLRAETTLRFYETTRSTKLNSIVAQGPLLLQSDEIVRALATLIEDISASARQVQESWQILSAALAVFKIAVNACRVAGSIPQDQIQKVLDVLHLSIIPSICGKNPGGLPESFHFNTLSFGECFLNYHTQATNGKSASDLYERYLKAPKNALIPQATDHESTSMALWRNSGRDDDVTTRLLGTCWTFQRALAFVNSDIMDVRNLGMVALKRRLLALYTQYNVSPEAFEHPVIQYAVRFLRENEMTPYILGPESHAGLITQGREVIVFLAATGMHTNIETDIIWGTCTTSVEADFAKAAFGVLKEVVKYLEPNQLFHIVEKYALTPLAKLSSQALDFFPELLMVFETKIMHAGGESDRKRLAKLSIQVLKNADNDARSPHALNLRNSAMAGVTRFTSAQSTFEQRKEIYENCVPEIVQKTKHATTAFEILGMFIAAGVPIDDITFILSLLRVADAVDELCHWAASCTAEGTPVMDDYGVCVRLDTMLYLMAQSQEVLDAQTCEQLYNAVFGNAEVRPAVRCSAWSKLYNKAFPDSGNPVAVQLWKVFMQEHVPSSSTELAFPQLIELICVQMKLDCASAEIRSDYANVLRLPLWDTVFSFALSSPRQDVVYTARTIILRMLFDFPISIAMPPATISRCHADFTKRLLDTLKLRFSDGLNSEFQVDGSEFTNGMDLLSQLLETSKDKLTAMGLVAAPKALVVDAADTATDRLAFDAHIHGPEVQPKKVEVLARASTTVTTLLSQLPKATCAGRNRVIVAGLEITDEPDKTLSDVGITHLGSLMISPRFAFGDDIDKALTPAGPVEQEILAQYSSVEAFLTGPDPLSEKAFDLLRQVRLLLEARKRVVYGEISLETIFPLNKPFRTRYSLHVLQTHLHDFVRVAVVDQSFCLRTVRTLTDLIFDDSLVRDPQILLEVVDTLKLFLNEPPPSGHSQPCFQEPQLFASRIRQLLSEVTEMPVPPSPKTKVDHVPLRTELAAIIYSTLLLACQTDEHLWEAVSSQQHEMVSTHEMLLLDQDVVLSAKIARQIDETCQHPVTPRNMPHYFWTTLFPVLSAALKNRTVSANYFTLLAAVLNSNHQLQSEEDNIRWLSQVFIDELSAYQHVETPELLMQDAGVVGLLRLLNTTIAILRSHKKAIGLDALGPGLMQRLLFPGDQYPSYPLIHPRSRALVYEIVRSTFTLETDYTRLVNTVQMAINRTVREPTGMFPGQEEWIRAANSFAGLNNLGMTCYMNSLLQQLFANLQFRKFVLAQPILDRGKQDVLNALQQLFGQMQNFTSPAIDPAPLATVLGVQLGVQEDVHTFYTALLSRLEDNLPSREQKRALTRFFTGKSVTQIRGDCGHVSSNEEQFTELSITVKEKVHLHESLDEFVQGEPLAGANKYKCMTCKNGEGQLVNARRRTCLEEVPDSLTLCLKRFAFENLQEGENKVNDRFDFPASIDMSRYKRVYLEDPTVPPQEDWFELVGVIVHQGSLTFGHYWSYIRVAGLHSNDPGAWVLVEDNRSTPVTGGFEEVRRECVGGLHGSSGVERADNGYVLFYQRKSFAAQARDIDIVPAKLQGVILPKVDVPTGLAENIMTGNLWRANLGAMFNNEFAKFVAWLLAQFPSVMEAQVAESESSASTEDSLSSTSTSEDERVVLIGQIISQFALRVLAANPDGESRLASLEPSLAAVLTARPGTAAQILHAFYNDRNGFVAVMTCKVPKVRAALYTLVQKCLTCVAEHDLDDYERVADAVIETHSTMLDFTVERVPGEWTEYLEFASNFAKQGQYETRLILDYDYLEWTLEVLFTHWDPKLKTKRNPIWQWMKANSGYDHTPLFAFIYEVLTAHVDLSIEPNKIERAGDERLQTTQGWSLTWSQLELIIRRGPIKSPGHLPAEHWLLYVAICKYCAFEGDNWMNNPPSKLIGLLVGDHAHPGYPRFVEEYMVKAIRWELHNLKPLLWTTLHFGFNTEDQLCQGITEVLSKSLKDWSKSEALSLSFLNEMYDLAPASVVGNCLHWAISDTFFTSKYGVIRDSTSEWLQDHLFGPEPLSGNTALDARRIHATRAFVKQCAGDTKKAFRDGKRRALYEGILSSMMNAKDYLTRLHDAVGQWLQAGDDSKGTVKANLSQEILVEYDESKATLSAVEKLLVDLEGWEPDQTALPTRPLGKKSLESEDLGDTEADEEELSSDDGVGSEEYFD